MYSCILVLMQQNGGSATSLCFSCWNIQFSWGTAKVFVLATLLLWTLMKQFRNLNLTIVIWILLLLEMPFIFFSCIHLLHLLIAQLYFLSLKWSKSFSGCLSLFMCVIIYLAIFKCSDWKHTKNQVDGNPLSTETMTGTSKMLHS